VHVCSSFHFGAAPSRPKVGAIARSIRLRIIATHSILNCYSRSSTFLSIFSWFWIGKRSKKKMCFDGSHSGGGTKLRSNSQLQQEASSPTWEVSQVREAFNLLDQDGDGTIKAEDLASFLQQSFKSTLTIEDIDLMISLADRDGSGSVNFDDFFSLLTQSSPVVENPKQSAKSFSSLGDEALREMFRMLDRNGDGVVCSEDLGGVMVEALGQSLSADDLTLMLETATGAGDRKVTFQDFCCLMNSTTSQ
jgi:Ca2+-binding EF-hand superfamily protein